MKARVMGLCALVAASAGVAFFLVPRKESVSAQVESLVPKKLKFAYTIKPASEELYTWSLGATDERGNFIFAAMHRDMPGLHKKHLISDYGFILLNEGTYDHPKPVYALGSLKAKRVEVFRSFTNFRKALSRLPHKADVYEYTVCTSGSAPGVTEKTWTAVVRAFRKAHLKYHDGEDYINSCYHGEGADPRPDARPELKKHYIRVYGEAAYKSHLPRKD
jgi:hypothetical protein